MTSYFFKRNIYCYRKTSFFVRTNFKFLLFDFFLLLNMICLFLFIFFSFSSLFAFIFFHSKFRKKTRENKFKNKSKNVTCWIWLLQLNQSLYKDTVFSIEWLNGKLFKHTPCFGPASFLFWPTPLTNPRYPRHPWTHTTHATNAI